MNLLALLLDGPYEGANKWRAAAPAWVLRTGIRVRRGPRFFLLCTYTALSRAEQRPLGPFVSSLFLATSTPHGGRVIGTITLLTPLGPEPFSHL